MPDDTKKPPTPDTIPTGPPIIAAGQARATLVQAEARLALALEEFTGVAEACARALDATATGGTP